MGANALLYERNKWNVIEANAWNKRNPESPRLSGGLAGRTSPKGVWVAPFAFLFTSSAYKRAGISKSTKKEIKNECARLVSCQVCGADASCWPHQARGRTLTLSRVSLLTWIPIQYVRSRMAVWEPLCISDNCSLILS